VAEELLRLDQLLARDDGLVEHRPRVALDGLVVPTGLVGE
jgi:hypothetical protein